MELLIFLNTSKR